MLSLPLPLSADTPSRPRWPRRLVVAVLLFGMLWLALLRLSPSVPARARPAAEDVAAGRAAVAQLRAAQGQPAATLLIDQRTLSGLAALASDATGYRHLDARLAGDRIAVALSVPVGLGQWLDLRASLAGSEQGFPPMDLQIGRVPLPRWAGRQVAELGRWWLRRKGTALPPLDTVVRRLTVSPAQASLSLALPGEGRLIEDALESGGFAPNPELAARIYCGLAAAQQRAPTDDFAIHVRRAFAGGAGDPERNRAAFAALAIVTAPDRVGEVVPAAAAAAAKACAPFPAPVLKLQGREDLAKHWSVSATIGATLGQGAARAIGEWKELSDSLAGGSGFSFVDLAADRAGLRAARRAIAPETAAAAAAHLASIDADRLLPPAVTGQAEGMTEAEFRARYGALDAKRYAAAVREIDRILDAAGQ